MSYLDACENIKTNSDLKFYELRKIKICEALSDYSTNNIAISNNFIFLATNKEIKIIDVSTILNFEWSNKVANQILEKYECLIIPLSFEPNYISICGGNNSILVVFVTINNVSQIQFFDLSNFEILKSQNFLPFTSLSIDFTNTNTPINQNLESNVKILNLDWHPEFNESLFIAVLSNGILISIGVSLSKRWAKLLGTLIHEKINCASWSPKGKQFAIGKSNGQIIQFKHKEGSKFEEAKTINPVRELNNFEVVGIKWCFSNLFVASFANLKSEDTFNVKIVTIYSKPNIGYTFNDHGPVCMENFNPNIKYLTNFTHLGNVILCCTSFASEIGVLVCNDIEKNLNVWNQIIFEDIYKVELPLKVLPKGFSLYQNETKQFKIDDTNIIGGKNFPLLTIFTSEGLLLNYYFYYKYYSKPQFLKTKFLEILPQNQISESYSNQEMTQNNLNSFTTNNQQNVQTNILQNQTQNSQVSSISEAEKQILDKQQQLQKQQLEIEKLQKIQKEKENERQKLILKQKQEENNTYLHAIKDELIQFSKIISEAKIRYQKTVIFEIGEENEKIQLTEKLNKLNQMINSIKDLIGSIDLEMLENFLFENFSLAENSKAFSERAQDHKFNLFLQKKPLDTSTLSKLKEINEKTIYIETNLKEINYILDQQWHEYIVSEKGKTQKAASPLVLIYQTLENNHRTLHSLDFQLRNLEPLLFKKNFDQKISYRKNEIKKLAEKFKKTSLKDFNIDCDIPYVNPNIIEVKLFPEHNKENLIRLLDQRSGFSIKKSVLPTDLNSSIMVSAVCKAKEKLKLQKSSKQPTIKNTNDDKSQKTYFKVENNNNASTNLQTNTTTVNKNINPNLTNVVNQPKQVFTQNLTKNTTDKIQSIFPDVLNSNKSISVLNLIQVENKQLPIISQNEKQSKNTKESNTIAQKPTINIKTNFSVIKPESDSTQSQPNQETIAPLKINQNPKLDQNSIVFDKADAKLSSSTPIKSIPDNQKPLDDLIKTSLFGQEGILQNDLNKKLIDNSKNLISNTETLDKNSEKNVDSSVIYEDISPPVSPTIETKENNNLVVTNSSSKKSEIIVSIEKPIVQTAFFSTNDFSTIKKNENLFQTSNSKNCSNVQIPNINEINNFSVFQNTSSNVKAPNFPNVSEATNFPASTTNSVDSFVTNVSTISPKTDEKNSFSISNLTTSVQSSATNQFPSTYSQITPTTSLINSQIQPSSQTKTDVIIQPQPQPPLNTKNVVSSTEKNLISSFGFSMCNLGTKTTSENTNKSVFNQSNLSSPLLPQPQLSDFSFGNPQAQKNSFLNVSSQGNLKMPIFNNQTTSVFSKTTASSVFNMQPTFIQTTTNFNTNTMNSSLNNNKNLFGGLNPTTTTYQQNLPTFGLAKPSIQNSFNNFTTPPKAPTFGGGPTFEAFNNSFTFGGAPTFGSQSSPSNNNIFPTQPSFESSFSNPQTFGCMNLNSNDLSFETIAHNRVATVDYTFKAPQFTERRA